MDNTRVLIKLTAEQKKAIRAATSRDVDTIELTVEELEERIAPGVRLQTAAQIAASPGFM